MHPCERSVRTPTCTRRLLAKPSSSAEGAPKVARAVVPVARQKRCSSNLEGILMTIRPYFSRKCSAISPTALPDTTTRAPLSAMPLMYSSSLASSDLGWRASRWEA